MGSLDELAASVAVYELRQAKWTYDTLQEFIRQNSDCQLGGDLFQVAMTWAAEDAAVLDLRGVTLSGVHVSEVNLDDAGVSGLRIRDSLVDRVVLGAFVSQSSVSFANCHINKVAGAISQSKLPEGIEITGATGETSFDTLDTTDAIVQFNVEDSVKALLVSLKKLFRQRGSGRVVGAFHRGLPQSIEVYVEPVLKMLINQGIAWKLRDVYHPVRKHSRRVHQLLDNPFASN
ncbi:MAG: hypothetical protein M5U25_11465 [Planctomycetota bacterium]|nr:hypothetical protein [Planctomycetota bacterium]